MHEHGGADAHRHTIHARYPWLGEPRQSVEKTKRRFHALGGRGCLDEIGNIIADRLLNPDSDSVAEDCRRRVASLCGSFPLYQHIVSSVPALA